MESIDKLRNYNHLYDDMWTLETGEIIYMYGSEPNDPNAINLGEQWRKIAEEIEQEIAERFMELPVDADGVPIRVGDVLSFNGLKAKCAAVSQARIYYWHELGCYWDWNNADVCRHVKPRTIEDVLTDFANEVARQGHQIGLTGHEIAMKYAEEIRGMMA